MNQGGKLFHQLGGVLTHIVFDPVQCQPHKGELIKVGDKLFILRANRHTGGALLHNAHHQVIMIRTEIKIVSTVPVTEIQKTVDGLAKELRNVDEKIQELNWTTELV